MAALAEVAQALDGIVSAMRADRYELEVLDASKDSLSLRIRALDGACDDCLAPEPVMATVLSGALNGRYAPEAIHITYPTGEPISP